MFCARLFICASWSPAGKGLTSWLSFVVSSVSLSLSHWYPGSGVVLDCIDSWSLQPYLLIYLIVSVTCVMDKQINCKSVNRIGYYTARSSTSGLALLKCYIVKSVARVFVCLFCCFTSQVNSYGHCGTVSSPNHTFSWASLNKQLTSTSCKYFRL